MLENLFQFKNIPIIISVLGGLILFVFLLLIFQAIGSKKKIEQSFLNQLDSLQGNLEYTKKVSLFSKWDKYITTRLRILGVIKYETYSNQTIGKRTFLLFLIVYLLSTVLFQNWGFGLIPIILILAFIHLKTASVVKGNNSLLNEQVGGFITIFKSNIQSGASSENALMTAIQKTKAPLRTELESVALMIETGSFQQALRILKNTTNNENLVFLCNGIEIAMSTGSNLEEYITTIEDVIEKKNEIKRKLDIAVAESMPLIYVSMALLPSLFLYQYLTNEQARNFWFKDTFSWIIFALVIIIYGAGLFLASRVVNRIDKF